MDTVLLSDFLDAIFKERKAVELNLGDGRSLMLVSRNEYKRLTNLNNVNVNVNDTAATNSQRGESQFPTENGTYTLKNGILTKVI